MNLETQDTEKHEAMHSGASDVPVAEEEGSAENKELRNVATCN
jgi:hypothetical protein